MMHHSGRYTPPEPSRADRKIGVVSTGHFTGHLIVDDGDYGVCQTCCPPISCGVSDFRGADFGF
ncbi:hypothetical protein SAMN04488004_11681 [Loktanella salsilacus]|uniref:Uncharacterized protein n=1 Tax=Loktanella salsilacus TaxID=195913 RepID=A0A1I4H8Z2_9RHOB|nr:hypothetical protein SAMN04488004_11681 [Loktanella salsilacus]